MFKKFLLASIAMVMVTSTSFAEQFYNADQTGAWSVFGSTGNESQNPACIAETTWEDGSKMQLIKDLATGELYIWFQNYAWNIGDAIEQDYPVRINMYDKAGNVVGGDFNYTLLNKNTIAIRNLDVKTFVPAFMAMGQIRLIMSGNIENALIPLQGSALTIDKMVECIQKSKSIPPANAPKSSTEVPKVPGQDI